MDAVLQPITDILLAPWPNHHRRRSWCDDDRDRYRHDDAPARRPADQTQEKHPRQEYRLATRKSACARVRATNSLNASRIFSNLEDVAELSKRQLTLRQAGVSVT